MRIAAAAAGGGAVAEVEAAGLKRAAVADGGDLDVAPLPRHPDLQSNGALGREGELGGAECHDAIGQREPLKHGLDVGQLRVEGVVRRFRRRDAYQLDLVELV